MGLDRYLWVWGPMSSSSGGSKIGRTCHQSSACSFVQGMKTLDSGSKVCTLWWRFSCSAHRSFWFSSSYRCPAHPPLHIGRCYLYSTSWRQRIDGNHFFWTGLHSSCDFAPWSIFSRTRCGPPACLVSLRNWQCFSSKRLDPLHPAYSCFGRRSLACLPLANLQQLNKTASSRILDAIQWCWS